MDYRKSLDYLYRLTQSGIKLGLENTARLLEYFGNPQLKVPTIHIAGTNGKGSTAAFTESILRAAGYRVGLYTSPHLMDFRERIQVDRTPIAREELTDLVCRVKKAAESRKVPMTFFEFGTVMAFLYFSEKKTDWNVIEVGLGGRLDATNLCRAEISILTSISKDHEKYLGSNLKSIAFEKASIIKEHGTVFADSQDKDVEDVILRVAGQRRAKVKGLGKDFHAERTSYDSESQVISFYGQRLQLENLALPLIGQHQVSNAALAIAACLELNSKKYGMISEKAVRQGLKNTRWEGRLEVVARNPTIILDCAHNLSGVRKMTETVREYFNYEQCLLVLGIMKDKPIDEMAGIFSLLAHRIILVKPQQARSEDPGFLYAKLQKYNKFVKIMPEIPHALKSIGKMANPKDIICVTGSLFTVAEAKHFFADNAIN